MGKLGENEEELDAECVVCGDIGSLLNDAGVCIACITKVSPTSQDKRAYKTYSLSKFGDSEVESIEGFCSLQDALEHASSSKEVYKVEFTIATCRVSIELKSRKTVP
jgi:hypothetical protein